MKFNEIKKKGFYITIWIILALIVTIIVEALTRENLESLKTFIVTRFSLFLLNYSIVLVLLLPILIFKKKISATVIPLTLILGFALAGKILNDKRGVPFTGADIYSIEYGIDMIFKYFNNFTLFFFLFLILCLILGYIILCRKEKGENTFKVWQKIMISLLAIIFCVGVYTKNIKNNTISNQLWNINYSYKRNGFLFSFIDSFSSLKMAKPQGYNKKKIESFNNNELAVLHNEDESPENIMLIQLESFIDPRKIEKVNLKENPIPEISKIKDISIASGKLKVPTYGAGTVRTEFEVLTGYNMDFMGVGEVPNNSVLKMKAVESLAQILRYDDYKSTMIHNYVGNFYHRDMVYSNYGFDTLVSKEYMSELEYNQSYPKDICNLKIVKELIERNEKQFIFNVSVESHGPYKPVENQKSYIEENEFLSQEERLEFDYFLNRLNGLDSYIGELIEYLSEIDEKTIIVFYSDHLPAISVFNKNKLVTEAQKYETEYFVWANYEVKSLKEEDLEAYELSTKLLDIANLNSGIIPNFHRKNKKENDYIERFKYIQYDQLYGANYFGSNYKSSNLQLGLNPVILNQISQDGNDILIKGENFTSSSRLFGNKKEYAIKYVNSNEIKVKNTKLETGIYKVIQKGMNGKALSESNSIKIK